VTEKLAGALGFTRLHVSSCIYVKREGTKVCFIYDYVDDFFVGGNCREFTDLFITLFREIINTTESIMNTSKLLGMEL